MSKANVKTAREQFDASKVQEDLRLGLAEGYQSADLRKRAKSAASSMSTYLMDAAKLCGTAAVFEAQMGVFGDWLKGAAGVKFCNEQGIKLSISGKTGNVNLPGTFRQYVSNILKGMYAHEDKAVRDDHGKPLVPHISTFESETKLREVVASEPVKEAIKLAEITTREGLTPEQREQASHDAQVQAAIRQRIGDMQRWALSLKDADDLDTALAAITEASSTVFELFTAQTDAENAAKAAAAELPEGAEDAEDAPAGVKAA